MLKNSILYRRFWYAKKRNSTNIHIISRLIAVIIIFTLLLTYVEKLIIPYLGELSQNKAEEIFIKAANSVIQDTLSSNYIHDNLISSEVDKDGNLQLMQINSLQAEKISRKLSFLVNKKLKAINLRKISLPLGTLTGIRSISHLGPLIHVKYTPYQNVELIVKSELLNQNTNQTTHILLIKIRSRIGIKFPFSEKNYMIFTEIPLTETLIFK